MQVNKNRTIKNRTMISSKQLRYYMVYRTRNSIKQHRQRLHEPTHDYINRSVAYKLATPVQDMTNSYGLARMLSRSNSF